MRQAAIFAWRKKNYKKKKQDACTAHAHCNFQETEKHIWDAAKALHAAQSTNKEQV